MGYFEVEVTSSGLKKNCQAGPPGPGWPLGSLHWPPGPFPPGSQPRSRGPQLQQWALDSKVALLVQYQARTLTQAQVLVVRPRYSERSVLGLPGGAQKCVSFPVCQGYNVRLPGELGSLGLCLLILRSTVLVTAHRSPVQATVLNHQKPAAGLLLCNDPTTGLLVSAIGLLLFFQTGERPQGIRALRLREMGALTEPWPWNTKGWWEEGDSTQYTAL